MKINFISGVVILGLIFSIHIAKVYAGVDSNGNGVAKTDPGEIKKTVDSLIKNKKTDREKIQVIYQWVRTNITYDEQHLKTYSTINFRDRSVDSTFFLRKGICMDFARLTCNMASLAGIKCEVVYGFGRYDERDFFRPPDELRHAWNAVYIDNKWLFMDPTWAGKNIKNNLVDNYFLVSPEAFIFSHFPDDKKWLLLNQSLTYDDFEKLPVVRSRFFEIIKTAPPKKGVYTTSNNFIVIEDLPIDSKIAANLEVRIVNTTTDDIEDADFTRVVQNGKSFLKVTIPEKGKYHVSIITQEKEDENLLIDVDLVTFLVERK